MRVFIGYDPRVAVTYNVAQHSLVTTSSKPVSITPLILEQLPIERMGLTAFTYSRFLVPYLCDYKGWALYMDPDMIVQDDIHKLFALKDEKYDAMVVKHEMRLERASLMLFNCEKCKILTPEYIEKNQVIHSLDWANVGGLPGRWNHLVDYDVPNGDVSLIHFTKGVPAFPEIGMCEHAQSWLNEHRFLNALCGYDEIMGNSVHVEGLSASNKR